MPRDPTSPQHDPGRDARGLAFDDQGSGDTVVLISGFPETRASWRQIAPVLAKSYRVVTIDLPGIGDSSFLDVAYSTRNVAEVFHAFVGQRDLGRIHLVAHDAGAWVGFTWSALYPGDFRSLTFVDGGIPGVALKQTVPLEQFMQRWHFLFQMVPDLPLELVRGKEDVYFGWWFKHKVHNQAGISDDERKAYARAYARPGRLEAYLDYYRAILVDMQDNEALTLRPIPVPVLGVGGEFGSVPEMGRWLDPYFDDVESQIIAASGHYVPEEQPEAFLQVVSRFLAKHSGPGGVAKM